jgi:glycosyltransferase involved in cell wall biosynthesis
MILPVYNEEARVGRVIEYYKQFARLLVIDNFSTDNTKQIVQKLGVELIQYKNPGTIQTPEWFRHVTALFDNDYFLLLSCSEFIPLPLLEIFNQTAIERTYDVVSCVRDSYTCGKMIPLWGGRSRLTEARIERFFNKQGMDYDSIVIHGKFSPTQKNRLLQLPRAEKNVIVHIRDFDAPSLIKKITEYAVVEAHHRAELGKSISCVSLLVLFLKEIIRFIQLPVSLWSRIALREVWARMVMHSVIYWVGWELRAGRTIEFSQQKSEELWQQLVQSQKGTQQKVTL